jgi:hypothetical protein
VWFDESRLADYSEVLTASNITLNIGGDTYINQTEAGLGASTGFTVSASGSNFGATGATEGQQFLLAIYNGDTLVYWQIATGTRQGNSTNGNASFTIDFYDNPSLGSTFLANNQGSLTFRVYQGTQQSASASSGTSFSTIRFDVNSGSYATNDFSTAIPAGSQSATAILDTLIPGAPTITTIGGSDSTVSGVTGDNQVVGTAEAGSTVTIRTGTTQLGTATADANGNWTYTLTSANLTTLGQGGSKSINAIQTDAAGNQGTTASAAFTFSVDNVAPSAPTITSIGGTDSTVSSVAGDNLVVGTAEANSTVTVRTGSTVLGTTTADSSGNWTYTLTDANITTLGQGSSRQINALATDVAGNQGTASGNRSFTVDTVAPTATVNAISSLSSDTGSSNSDFITNAATQTIQGTFTGTVGTGESIQVSADGGVTWVTTTRSGSSWTATGVTLQSGTNTLLTRTVDTAGNVTPGASRSYTLDTVALAPDVALTNDTGSSNTDRNTSNGALTITAENGATIQYSTNGTTWTNSFTPVQGSNTVQVRQIDVAGNTSAATTFSFTLDTIAPNAPGVALTSDTGSSNSDRITNNAALTLANLEANATVQYSTNNGQTWTSSFTPVQGSNTVLVRQVDVAGNNSTSTTFTFTFDNVAPTAATLGLALDSGSSSSDGITNSGVVNVSGLETGSIREYSTNNGQTWTAFTGTSFTLSGDGAKSVVVRQTDAAGNISANSAALNFTLDTAAPTAAGLSLALDSGSSNSDGITNSGVVNVSGLEANSIRQYSTDNGQTWTSFIGTSFTLSGDGAKSVVVRQTDVAGNISTSNALSFTLDTTTPGAVGFSGTSIAENNAANAVVATLSATDNGNVTYSLVSGEGGTDNNAFTISGNQLLINTSADFEAKSSYSIRIRTTDAAGNFTETTQTINVTNVDEVPPTITSGTTGSVAENAPTSTVIYTATAIDTDFAPGTQAVTYSLSGDDAALLNIDASTGVVTLKNSADFETKSSYSFTVTATDALGNASTPQSVIVNVTDVDEVAPVFTSGTTGSVAENAPTSTVIYTATATDASAVTYSLSGDDAALLNIDASTGVVTLKNSADFETKSSYSFTVTATDALGNASTPQSVIVNVTDVDEVAPVFTSGTTGSVAENAPTSTVIYTATATDASAVTYSLSGDDAALLNIDASTGVVTLKNSADFETKSSYSFTVTATDALGNASTPQSVIVNVTDVDEVAPVFTSGTTGSVVENAPTSTVIYTATATDASAVTYSLSGDDAALLNIDASTGVVTLKNSADFETKSSYSFTVTATDALGNASTPQSVIVNVTDVDEVAPVFTSGTTGSVAENAPTSTVIYTATATDASAVTYSLSGDDATLLNIDASTGVVTLKNSADFETKSSYSFTVTATDALGNASTPQSVIVNVTDVDEVASGLHHRYDWLSAEMLPPAPSSTPQRQRCQRRHLQPEWRRCGTAQH